MMLLAIPFLFAYIMFLTLPVWLAAFEDDIEDESHRLDEVVEPSVEPGVEV